MNKSKVKLGLESKDENELRLKQVTKIDLDFLYELLDERDLEENISHKNRPSYIEHRKFVLSNPYAKWYVIMIGNKKIGSIYLSRINEIGLHLKKEYQFSKLRAKSLHLLMKKNPRDRYFANINPKNIESLQFFKKKGFKLIQHTYELSIEK